jgi:magnesium-protoporphyrin IX monomethyl ester (oxidative) cyclase
VVVKSPQKEKEKEKEETHFVQNPKFKATAEKLQGPLRQIFVEFLECSCTVEFSGLLL